MNGQDFDTWLAATQRQRDALFEYAKTEMPTDPALVGGDIDRSIRAEEAAGLQLIDAKFFLTGEKAKAVLKFKDPEYENKNFSASERAIMVRMEVRELVRLVERLELVKDIFVSRRINGFGMRKSI